MAADEKRAGQGGGRGGTPPGGARRRVTFVASTLEMGGTERMVREFATRLDKSRYSVSVVCLNEQGRVGAELASVGVTVLDCVVRWRWDPLAVFRLRSALSRLGSQMVVCLDHRNAMTLGVLASLGVAKRRMVTVHSTRLWSGQRILGGTVSWVLRYVDRVVAVGRNQAEYLCDEEGVDPAKIAIVPNGVDMIDFRGLSDPKAVRASLGLKADSRVVGIVGALRPEKNHELFLEAASDVARQDSGTEFVVVGGGGRQEELEALASQLGLRDRVSFLGHRTDARDIVQTFDVAVLCSHPVVETLPVFLMEAMACARPIVATRVGDVEALVEHAVTGYVVTPGSRSELSEAILRLLGNVGLREEMGRKGRSKVTKEFSLERSVLTMQNLIDGELDRP